MVLPTESPDIEMRFRAAQTCAQSAHRQGPFMLIRPTARLDQHWLNMAPAVYFGTTRMA